MTSQAADYPVTFDVEPQQTGRNRKTVFFRIIWAFPHLLIVGSSASFLPVLGAGAFWYLGGSNEGFSSFGGGSGGLGAVAFTMAVVAWFAIMFAHTHPSGLWDFCYFALRWQARVNAYVGLLRDDYPPFGDGDYPARVSVGEMPADQARKSVGWRLILVIPHYIVLFFIGIAWIFTTAIAWFAILFTGSYPEGLYRFSVGYLRWSMRVQAYLLLLQDEYPPFSLD